jgi:hypothetical protein
LKAIYQGHKDYVDIKARIEQSKVARGLMVAPTRIPRPKPKPKPFIAVPGVWYRCSIGHYEGFNFVQAIESQTFAYLSKDIPYGTPLFVELDGRGHIRRDVFSDIVISNIYKYDMNEYIAHVLGHRISRFMIKPY